VHQDASDLYRRQPVRYQVRGDYERLVSLRAGGAVPCSFIVGAYVPGGLYGYVRAPAAGVEDLGFVDCRGVKF
jgi:hypothetical protein